MYSKTPINWSSTVFFARPEYLNLTTTSNPGTSGEINGVVFANLEYYTRLKFPITHSLTLFKERMKANTYLNNNNQPGPISSVALVC